MLSNLRRSVFSLVNASKTVNSSPLLATSVTHLSSKVEQRDELFEKEYKSKVKYLEQFGLVKSHISWPQYNRIIYPPSENGQDEVKPFVHHMRSFIKYPAKKLWYPAHLIRGLSIDEAIKQLSFHKLKGASIIKEVILEARDLAIKQHNIEYESNMWISYSTAIDCFKIKGVRKHRAFRFGIVEYKYSTYYVRLEEGQPPANYNLLSETYENRAKLYINKLREKQISLSL